MATRVKGADVVRRRLRVIQRAAFDALEAQIREEAGIVLARSRDLAPQLTGKMIATSGLQVEARRSADAIRATVYYTEKYALYQHEGVYNPGPVTQAKLGSARGIGRKFLQRALEERRDQIAINAGRAIERSLRLTLR